MKQVIYLILGWILFFVGLITEDGNLFYLALIFFGLSVGEIDFHKRGKR